MGIILLQTKGHFSPFFPFHFQYKKLETMTTKAKKLNAVICELHNAMNVYYENFNGINEKISRKADKTTIATTLERCRNRYNKLTNQLI